MKTSLQRSIFILFIFTPLSMAYMLLAAPSSTMSFASRDSTLAIASGARFNATSGNLAIDGTLKKNIGAEITGNTITFNDGVLASGGLEAVLTGSFDPVGTDILRLQGNGRFKAEPGTVLEALIVDGTGNSIEGQPLFSGPITLTDAGTSLALSLQSALNQNIILNNGTVTLGDHLSLNDNVRFVGNGRIELNNRQMCLGSVYNAPWTNSLYFNNGTDVVINGTIDLTGTWTFGGVSVLSSHGGIIDLSKGGKIIIDNGAKLLLDNVHVTGIGNNAGQIVFRNGESQLRTANTTFKLNDDMLQQQGTFYVNGPTTFQLGDNGWTFSNNANLTVDGTTLWLDYLDSPAYQGTIWAPRPLFDGTKWNKVNLLTDLAGGNLSLINRGTIKQSVDESIIDFDPAWLKLLSGNFSGFVALSHCGCLGYNDIIRVTGDGFVDGQGVTVRFTDPNHPQLVIMPGVSLTLKDIFFENINNISFDLRENSSLIIDKNVVLGLDADFTFSANATMQILDTDAGVNILTLRGGPTRRQFKIAPMPNILPSGRPNKTFNLGHNSILLENVQISGLDYISFVDDGISPAIGLSGNAGVDLYSDFLDNNNLYGTALNFWAEGINNDMIVRQDGFVLYGNVAFGNFPDNDLNFKFSLADPLLSTTPGRSGVLDGYPFVILRGDPGIFIWSEDGIARLNFVDFYACVRNMTESGNGFVADANALLTYNYLQLLDNPVKQQSALFRYSGLQLSGEKIDPSFIRKPEMLTRSANVVVSAIFLKRQQEKLDFLEAQEQAIKQAKQKQILFAGAPKTNKHKIKPLAKKKKLPKPTLHRSLDLGQIETPEWVAQEEITRGLSLTRENIHPFTGTPSSHSGGSSSLTVAISGEHTYQKYAYNSLLVDSGIPFNALYDGATVGNENTVKLGANVTLVSGTHYMNFKGTNTIDLNGKALTIKKGTVLFDDNAQLIFTSSAPGIYGVVVIDGDITLPKGVNIEASKNVLLLLRSGKVVCEGSSSLPSGFSIKNNCYMQVEDGASITMSGYVSLKAEAGGTIQYSTSPVGSLVIDAKYYSIDVTSKGNLYADLSLLKGAGVISCTNGGIIYVLKDKKLGLNTDGTTATGGRLYSFDLTGGQLFFDDESTFFISDNPANPTLGGNYKFAFDPRNSTITNKGYCTFVGVSGSKIEAKMLNNDGASFPTIKGNYSPRELFLWLVKKPSSLTTSFLFDGKDGKPYVWTKGGVQVLLLDSNGNQIIVYSDDKDGNIYCDTDKTGFNRVIRSDGKIEYEQAN